MKYLCVFILAALVILTALGEFTPGDRREINQLADRDRRGYRMQRSRYAVTYKKPVETAIRRATGGGMENTHSKYTTEGRGKSIG